MARKYNFYETLRPLANIVDHAELIKAQANEPAFNATVSTNVKKPKSVGASYPSKRKRLQINKGSIKYPKR